MVMEAQDHQEFTDQTQIMIKGKRTKRQRPMSPLTLAMASSSSSTGGGGEGGRISDHHDHVATALTERTENEEEDMANCLILLAQGNQDRTRKLSRETGTCTNYNNASSTAAARGLYVYQCKTCSRCFPSFQALGGHRASHKKPKTTNTNYHEEKKTFCLVVEEEDRKEETHDGLLFNNMNTTLSLRISNNNIRPSNNNINKSKVHECSICGAEFSSGQALGGHMRRHRMFTKTSSTTTTTLSIGTSSKSAELSQESKKPRNNNLQLDLNLPAPEDDHRESNFSFMSKQQILVFSTSTLVDCHY